MPVSKKVQEMGEAGLLSFEDAVPILCPVCGTEYAGIQEKERAHKGGPNEMDPSICFDCGNVLIFLKGRWTKAERETREMIFNEFPHARQIVAEIRAAYANRNN